MSKLERLNRVIVSLNCISAEHLSFKSGRRSALGILWMFNHIIRLLGFFGLISLISSVPFNLACAGQAVRIVQGNALEVDGKKVILNGVAIPVPTAKCLKGEATWPCGAAATLRLNEILKSSSIQCETADASQETLLAKCLGSDGDIAEQLVSEGWAITVEASDEYWEHERYARSKGIGIWREGNLPPDSWRQYPELLKNPVLELLCSSCAARKQ